MDPATKRRLIGAVLGAAAGVLLVAGVGGLRSQIGSWGASSIQRQVTISEGAGVGPTVKRWRGWEGPMMMLEGEHLGYSLFAPTGIEWELPLTHHAKIKLLNEEREAVPVESGAMVSAIQAFASGDLYLGPVAAKLQVGTLETDIVYWKNIVALCAVGLVWLGVVGVLGALSVRQFLAVAHLSRGCPRCGYSPEGLPVGAACPECGNGG